MKKVLILTLTILLSNLSFGQEIPKLELTQNGVEPIVVEVDSMTATEIYQQALYWVQETYKNPDKVLKAKIQNEKIRIDGFASNAWWLKTLGMKNNMDMEYVVEIEFKDGKYRFDYQIGQFYVGSSGQRALYDYSTFYKRNGEVRKMYDDAIPSIELTMNSLSQSFYNYVTGKTEDKNDDW